MKSFYLLVLMIPFLVQCAPLQKPGEGSAIAGEESLSGSRIIENSAKAAGVVWRNTRKVTIAYQGQWTGIATRVQPILTDKEFRKQSVETFYTRSQRIEQEHRGPGGVKSVMRTKDSVTVQYNDEFSSIEEKDRAAALVADAYRIFTFRASWLAEEAEKVVRLKDGKIGGTSCFRVQGSLSPGLGFSKSDQFIAWFSQEDFRMLRFQFTIDGLESTKGADVSVDFSRFQKAKDGSLWPTYFVERVIRPIPIVAHEWETVFVEVDGRIVLGER